MLIDLATKYPAYYALVVVSVIVSIVLHELAHGWAALSQGDPTPKTSGHMTWNPMVHMGGLSLVLLFVVGLAFGAMPVNPSRFRSRYGRALVAFAGPAMNLLLGLTALLLCGGGLRMGLLEPPLGPGAINPAFVLLMFGELNLILCAINLLPIPPLDGATVLGDFWPKFRAWSRDPNMAPIFQGALLLVFFMSGQLWEHVRHFALEIVALVAGA